MKLNLKILKAINKGIHKSLLSFDDIEFSQSSNSNLRVSKSIKDWKWIQDNFVDLGLPSGTLWSKWNIGATNGDTPESWYGNYYAFGEIHTKGTYDESNYTYTENLDILPLDKDVAYLTNNLMYMPSEDQIQELISLPNKWVTDYNNVSGLNGRLFTGINGNELFIPASGYRYGFEVYDKGYDCYLWSSSHYTVSPDYAWYLSFGSGNINIYYSDRYYGRSVRGVIDNR